MYTSIYLLAQSNAEKSKAFQGRWNTKRGTIVKEAVLKHLRKGTIREFLRKEFAEKKLPILEHDKDLRGILLADEDLSNCPRDALKGFDLSYAYIMSTNFKDLDLDHTNFSFTSLYHVGFINCAFSHATIYASYLENVMVVGCDFLNRNNIRNCRLSNVQFKHCFIERDLFHSCRFDEQTVIDKLALTSRHTAKPIQFNPRELPELYKGIKEGYLYGSVIKKSNDYYFLERQAVNRYLVTNKFEKFVNYFIEIVAGYGIRPLRVFICMMVLFAIFSLIFLARLGYPEGLLLSTGAYFTNGVSSQSLASAGLLYQSLFILESFLGIVFTTLFVTVMANLWLSEK
jgi:hypothetical protein